jgi:hypothetical protein
MIFKTSDFTKHGHTASTVNKASTKNIFPLNVTKRVLFRETTRKTKAFKFEPFALLGGKMVERQLRTV